MLSSIYSNLEDKFSRINFVDGLNVVIAEIRLPENKNIDTHNLGKSTLAKLIDFGMLKGKHPEFFLYKHEDIFKDFVFFLEIKLKPNSFLTIRRSVSNHSKVAFKLHDEQYRDFSDLDDELWDHSNIAFEKAITMLDGYLAWSALAEWDFRRIVGYLLRSQEDYNEVFKLRKFQSKDRYWKPFLAHLLGFDGEKVSTHYQLEEDVDSKKKDAEVLRRELGGEHEDASKIEGLLLLKNRDAATKKNDLDAYNFSEEDRRKSHEVVGELESAVARLNNERYSLLSMESRIKNALGDGQIDFNPDDAKKLFEEIGVFFDGQLKKDFEQLVQFNRQLTIERSNYLREELQEITDKLVATNAELRDLNARRQEALKFIGSKDFFEKYRELSEEYSELRAEIISLEAQKETLHRLQEARSALRLLEDNEETARRAVEDNVSEINSNQDSLFASVRVFFNEIIEEVISQKALIKVDTNNVGHIVFDTEILDAKNKPTSADEGNTYKKLLSIAFDLALLRAHILEPFPRFVFHDGVFEAVERRKREKLLDVVRRYADMGVQYIITLVDSDMPPSDAGSSFTDEEIVLILHDEGDDGRLFKMPSW
jgi:uncharacterized protein YydD (DUF2326 family)